MKGILFSGMSGLRKSVLVPEAPGPGVVSETRGKNKIKIKPFYMYYLLYLKAKNSHVRSK